MLLIWGFKIRSKLLSDHTFFCPGCGGDRSGRLLAARRWFTFFWIPLIPLKQVGEYVACDTCHGHFEAAVLDLPTTATLGGMITNATHALTLMMVRMADTVSPELQAHALRDLRGIIASYDELTLHREVAQIDTTLAEQYVAPLADGLEVTGKERMMADLVRTGLADGNLSADQRHLIDRVGRGLGLTPAHITGIVANVAAAGTPPTPHQDDIAPSA
ncbi:MAG: zinc-ribbon domain-containing protein [Aquihabitans sp.]